MPKSRGTIILSPERVTGGRPTSESVMGFTLSSDIFSKVPGIDPN